MATLTTDRVAGRALVTLLCLDGAAVLSLFALAAVEGPAILPLAVGAGASWALAVAGVPAAVLHQGRRVIAVARMRVVTGMAINAIGSLLVLIAYPSHAAAAVFVLVGGTALSVGYLTFLTPQHPSARRSAAPPRR